MSPDEYPYASYTDVSPTDTDTSLYAAKKTGSDFYASQNAPKEAEDSPPDPDAAFNDSLKDKYKLDGPNFNITNYKPKDVTQVIPTFVPKGSVNSSGDKIKNIGHIAFSKFLENNKFDINNCVEVFLSHNFDPGYNKPLYKYVSTLYGLSESELSLVKGYFTAIKAQFSVGDAFRLPEVQEEPQEVKQKPAVSKNESVSAAAKALKTLREKSSPKTAEKIKIPLAAQTMMNNLVSATVSLAEMDSIYKKDTKRVKTVNLTIKCSPMVQNYLEHISSVYGRSFDQIVISMIAESLVNYNTAWPDFILVNGIDTTAVSIDAPPEEDAKAEEKTSNE